MTKRIFAFELYDDSNSEIKTLEEAMIARYCKDNNNYEYQYFTKQLPLHTIPIGSVEWCEKVYGPFIPNYYPDFLNNYLSRKIWKSDYKTIYNSYKEPVFIKPANKYKKWSGFVYKQNRDEDIDNNDNISIDDNEELWCSEVVHFINEWRYYIINGEVHESSWYDGDISDTDVIAGLAKPAPNLPLDILTKLKEKKYYGVIDMGEIMLNNKLTLALIEAVEPYAIGWYFEESSYKKYGEFIIKSDRYLRSKIL